MLELIRSGTFAYLYTTQTMYPNFGCVRLACYTPRRCLAQHGMATVHTRHTQEAKQDAVAACTSFSEPEVSSNQYPLVTALIIKLHMQ